MASPNKDDRFQEIARERVADRIARELLRLIASGELAPGERLPGERHLAEMMCVSRVSVRAALQQLKAQGFVSAIQGGGTRINAAAGEQDSALAALVRLDDKNLHDLAEIRIKIEAWAAQHAADRAGPEQIQEIQAAFDLMAQPDRRPRFKAEDDLNFHMAIAKASGSAVYMHLMTTLGNILEQIVSHHRYRLYSSPADDRILLEDHRAILNAIRAGDGQAAAAAMEAHLTRMLTRYGDIEEERPAGSAEDTPQRAAS